MEAVAFGEARIEPKLLAESPTSRVAQKIIDERFSNRTITFANIGVQIKFLFLEQ